MATCYVCNPTKPFCQRSNLQRHLEAVHKKKTAIEIGANLLIIPKVYKGKLRVILERREKVDGKRASICLYLKQYGNFRVWHGTEFDLEYQSAKAAPNRDETKGTVIQKDLGYDATCLFDGIYFTIQNKFGSFFLSNLERDLIAEKDEEIEAAIQNCKEVLIEVTSQ